MSSPNNEPKNKNIQEINESKMKIFRNNFVTQNSRSNLDLENESQNFPRKSKKIKYQGMENFRKVDEIKEERNEDENNNNNLKEKEEVINEKRVENQRS